MFRRMFQLTAISLVVVSMSRCEILQIRWPKAPTTPQNNESFVTIDCYTELTNEHLNVPILVNHTAYDWRRPCLIRIPTKTEVVFTLTRTDPRSSLRVVAGDSRSVQHMATAKLHKKPNSSFTLPVYVGCRYATIVYRPYTTDDYLLFVIRPARADFVDEEDKDICLNAAQDEQESNQRRRRANFNFF